MIQIIHTFRTYFVVLILASTPQPVDERREFVVVEQPDDEVPYAGLYIFKNDKTYDTTININNDYKNLERATRVPPPRTIIPQTSTESGSYLGMLYESIYCF